VRSAGSHDREGDLAILALPLPLGVLPEAVLGGLTVVNQLPGMRGL
jgi:hypothetical protein